MENTKTKKNPAEGVDLQGNKLTLYRQSAHNRVFFPVREIDLDFDDGAEWANQFELRLRYRGQMIQLKVEPSLPDSLTPQDSIPVHDKNCMTGGNPDLTVSNEVETLTVLFATVQS